MTNGFTLAMLLARSCAELIGEFKVSEGLGTIHIRLCGEKPWLEFYHGPMENINEVVAALGRAGVVRNREPV